MTNIKVIDPFVKTRAGDYIPKNHGETTDYFIGKPCTIICKDSSLVFKDPEQYYKHFFGIVETIDQEGVLLQSGPTKSYYFKENILAIIEEKIQNNIEVKKEIKSEPPQPINWDTISKLGK